MPCNDLRFVIFAIIVLFFVNILWLFYYYILRISAKDLLRIAFYLYEILVKFTYTLSSRNSIYKISLNILLNIESKLSTIRTWEIWTETQRECQVSIAVDVWRSLRKWFSWHTHVNFQQIRPCLLKQYSVFPRNKKNQNYWVLLPLPHINSWSWPSELIPPMVTEFIKIFY